MSLPAEVADHVEAEAEVVRQAPARIVLLSPVCAIGLTYVRGARPIVSMAAVLNDAERLRMFGARSDERALWSLWHPADWPLQLPDALLLADEPERVERTGRAQAALEAADVRDPLKLIHREIARKLGERPPEIPLTDDFLAFATAHELSEATLAELRSYAPAAAVARYEQRGWLRLPDVGP
jgi:hypothetical protein